MKKVKIVVLILFLVLLALWSPWLYIKINIGEFFGVQKPQEIAGLQVNSLAGEIEVYLNGELKGTSSANRSPFILDRINPGSYLITLKRKTNIRGAYWDFNKLVQFIPGTSVIISYNLGPEEEFSEGHIIYAAEKENQNSMSKLNIQTNIEDPEINFESSEIQKINSKLFSSEINFDNPKKLSLKKKGYDSLEFKILPENEEERKILSRYNLNIEVHLILQPVQVE